MNFPWRSKRRRLEEERGRPEVRRAILGSLPIGSKKRERHLLWRLFLWSGIALLLLQVQSGILPHIPFLRLDITALLLFFIASELGTIEGALSAFALGYVADLFVMGPPGLCRFLAVAIWIVGHILSPRATRAGWFGASALVFGISIALQAGVLGAESLVRPSWEAPGVSAWVAVVPVAFFTAAFAAPARSLLRRLDRMTAGSVIPNER